MSYDLMVFEASVAPKSREEFMEWYAAQTEWSEDHGYQDHAVTSEALQNWFKEMIEHFPPMNGPLASDDVDDPKITDHCIGKNVIYSAFAWSEAEGAYSKMRELAIKHSVGFFDVSADNGEILFPGKPSEVKKTMVEVLVTAHNKSLVRTQTTLRFVCAAQFKRYVAHLNCAV